MARPRSDIRPRLVAAAREAFLTQGVDGASLRDIAADAGTSVGMVTYYFPTKDDLFLAVLEGVYPKLVGDLGAEIVGAKGPLRERVARLYLRAHTMSEEEFAVVRIIIREALVSSERLSKLFKRFTADGAHVPLLLQLLGQGMATQELRDDLPPLGLMVAALALAMGPVFVRRRLEEIGPRDLVPSAEVAASVMSKVLFEGIGAKKKPAKRRRK